MAVSKVVNGMSREPRAVVPEAVGPEGLLLRLDLRNYGWQRPITLEGQSYADAWQAVSARANIALELQGGVADELSNELGTRVPVLLSSAFVATATTGALYYAVLNLPATLVELKRELGIVADEDLERGPWVRAAFSNSGTSKEPRGVARYRGTDLGDGYYWQTFDYAPSVRADLLYLEPLATRADGHQVLFSLPNGLPAYFTTDGDGARLLESRFVLDPAQNNGRVPVSSSCVSCHNGGTITFTDGARPFVEDNTDLFSEAVVARVREVFPSAREMQALLDADSQRMVEGAERAGQPKGAPDPVSRVALDYELGLTFDQVAAELFLDRASLIERLPSLPETIAAAATSGTLERSTFEALYLQAACTLYGSAESSPVGCP
jgi:serine/threonine-protein kinase